MHLEFQRLENLGWALPSAELSGLFTPELVDESRISFPSERYCSDGTNAEASGFWATERANAIARLLRAAGANTLWEIGAGNGNAAIPLRNLGFEVFPVEPLRSGAVSLAKNGFLTFHATLENLKLPDNSISAIGAFDVLEHLENPEALLSEVHRVLMPGGIFVCSVPAYQWLFSDFDTSIGHYRRYSRRDLIQLLSSANFKCEAVGALFGFLVLPAFLLRRVPYLLKSRRPKLSVVSSVGASSSIVNRLGSILAVVTWLERILRLPFGLSLISIARKP
jgi:SAM-dependent methyltransferase